MNKKGLLFGQIAMMIFAAAVILLIVYFGFKAFSSTSEDFKSLDIMDLQMTLESTAKDVKAEYGSKKEITVSVPKEITEICFMSAVSSQKLPKIFRENNQMLINTHDDGAGGNVFFKGEEPGDFIPMHIDDITTEDGLECFTPGAGKVTITFEGTGTNTKIGRERNFAEMKKKIKHDVETNNEIRLTSPRYLAEVVIPKDTALQYSDDDNIYITFKELTEEHVPGMEQKSYVYELLPNETTIVGLEPIVLTIGFDPQEVNHPERLRMYYYDVDDGWTVVCGTMQKDDNSFAYRCDDDKVVVNANTGGFYASVKINELGFTKYVLGY